MKSAICALFLVLYVSPALGDETKDRQAIASMAAAMFEREEFSELNELAKRYLQTEERTSSGLWKLGLLYGGIGDTATLSVRDERFWKRLEDKAQRWIDTYPNSPSGYLVYADFLINQAWAIRGGGWARDVKPEDWKPFYAHMAQAKAVLLESKAITSQDPRWYDLMIIIAQAEGWSRDEFNRLVNEATGRAPYFYPIYFAAVEYLLPQWHGSKADIENFAQKAVAITRNREKSAMYARIYWYASQIHYGNALFTDTTVVWDKMSRSMDDVLEQYPAQWNINNFAFFACLAGDANKTRSLMEKIEGTPDMLVWKTMALFIGCKELASKASNK